jgi:hypothetical protein
MEAWGVRVGLRGCGLGAWLGRRVAGGRGATCRAQRRPWRLCSLPRAGARRRGAVGAVVIKLGPATAMAAPACVGRLAPRHVDG